MTGTNDQNPSSRSWRLSHALSLICQPRSLRPKCEKAITDSMRGFEPVSPGAPFAHAAGHDAREADPDLLSFERFTGRHERLLQMTCFPVRARHGLSSGPFLLCIGYVAGISSLLFPPLEAGRATDEGREVPARPLMDALCSRVANNWSLCPEEPNASPASAPGLAHPRTHAGGCRTRVPRRSLRGSGSSPMLSSTTCMRRWALTVP
jgi:hypothetical protein